MERIENESDMLTVQLHHSFPHKFCGENIAAQPHGRTLTLDCLDDQFLDFLQHGGGLRHISAEQVQLNVLFHRFPNRIAFG